MVAVETIQLKKRFEEGGFYSKIFEVEIGDKKEAVVVKSIQRHKVKIIPSTLIFKELMKKPELLFLFLLSLLIKSSHLA